MYIVCTLEYVCAQLRPDATSAVSFHCVRRHACECDNAFALFLRGVFVPVTSLATGFAPSGVSQAQASVLPFAVRVGGVLLSSGIAGGLRC